MKKANISINFSDSPKMIHHSTKILSDINIDIEKLNSNNYKSTITGNKIFFIDMQVNIPLNGIRIEDVSNKLKPLKDIYGVSIIIK